MRKLLIALVPFVFACAAVQVEQPKKDEAKAPAVAKDEAKAPAAAAGKVVANPREEDFPLVIAKSGVKVDGDLADWPAGLPVGRVANADGSHAANFRVFVDAARVYLAVEVKDTTPSVNTQGPGRNWDGEAVELFLGTHAEDRSGLAPGDVQVIISYNPAAPLAWNYFSGKPMTSAQVSVKDAPGGWLVEASFSLAELGLTAPVPGAPAWIDLALDNSDGGGRTAQLVWLGSADVYRTPLMWKKTTFVAQP